MRTTVLLFVISLFLLPSHLQAQAPDDSLAIKKACLDYIEGWAKGDISRLENGVSPELVKRTINRDKDGLCYTSNMSRSHLIIVSKPNQTGVKAPDLDPGKPFNPGITILDIQGDYATVKITSAKYGFFDYCQVARFNGEWQLINVLWGFLPQKK